VHFLLRCDKIVNILHKGSGEGLAKLKAEPASLQPECALDLQTIESASIF
jgi:hypothetical protein